MKLSKANKRVLVNMSIVAAIMLIPLVMIAGLAALGNYITALQDQDPATAACLKAVSSHPDQPIGNDRRLCRSFKNLLQTWQERNKHDPVEFTEFLNNIAKQMATPEPQQ